MFSTPMSRKGFWVKSVLQKYKCADMVNLGIRKAGRASMRGLICILQCTAVRVNNGCMQSSQTQGARTNDLEKQTWSPSVSYGRRRKRRRRRRKRRTPLCPTLLFCSLPYVNVHDTNICVNKLFLFLICFEWEHGLLSE
jgi:hypothetical protein